MRTKPILTCAVGAACWVFALGACALGQSAKPVAADPAAAHAADGGAPAIPAQPEISPAMKQALGKKIKLNLLGVDFKRALDFIRKESGIPVIVDRAAISKSMESKVDLDIEEVTISEALDLIFAEVGNTNVAYDIRDGRIFVSSPPAILKPRLQTRIYDVRTITSTMTQHNDAPTVGVQPLISEVGRGSTGGSLFDDESGDEEVASQSEIGEALISLLKLSVRDGNHNGNWEIEGVSMTHKRGLLIVVNTPEIHGSIDKILKLYQDAYGKMVGMQAKFILVRTDALETFLAQNDDGSLILTPQKLKSFKQLLSGNTVGTRTLGTARTICFNTQRVNVTAGNEESFVSDLTPIIGTNSLGNDPEVSALANSVVLDVRPIIDFDDKSVSLHLRAGIALGGKIRAHAIHGQVGPGHPGPDGGGAAADNAAEKKQPPAGIIGQVASVTSMIELASQDTVRFRTTARVPSGGAVILSGFSDQFKQMAKTEGSEIIMLLEAKVTR